MTAAGSITPHLVEALHRAGAVTALKHPLSECTTFKLGGPCPLLVDCRSGETVAAVWSLLAAAGIKPVLIGGGSNLLVSDHGIDQVVVRYVDPEAVVRIDGTMVTVSAGANLDRLAAAVTEAGLDGLTVCSGIPGTVGGAIAGNAGAFGRQMGDALLDVDVLDSRGTIQTIPGGQLGFSYRHSRVAELDVVLLRARFALKSAPAEQLRARREEILALRASKHPDWRKTPTAGSFFKNIEPTSNAERRQAAGWYLEQAGALGMRVGGASTFARHANIVIAGPGATASDVKQLTDQMAAAVKAKFDLVLQREVKIIGSFS